MIGYRNSRRMLVGLFALVAHIATGDAQIKGVVQSEDGVEPRGWVGVYDDPIDAAGVARRWMRFRDGSFSVSLQAGVPANLVVSTPASASPIVHRITPPSIGAHLTLAPPLGTRIEGVVRSVTGRPIARAEISVAASDGWLAQVPRNVLPSWRSIEGGAFTIPGLIVGSYRVSAVADDYVPLVDVEVVVSDNRRFDLLRLEMLPVDLAIVGRVVDGTGTGVDGAEVVATAGALTLDGKTTRGGRFSLGPLTDPGEAVISASLGGSISSALRVAAPTQNVEIVLEPSSGIRGTVFDTSAQEPIGTFDITTHQIGGHEQTHSFADANGTFAFDLPAKTNAVTVQAEGYVPWSKAVDLVPGEYTVIEAVLDSGRSVAGQVIDAVGGIPIAAATVEVEGARGPSGANIGGMATHTDDQGRFQLRVHSGDRGIRVRRDGYATKTVRVPDPAREAIVVALDEGGTVAGRLVLSTGGPATGNVTLAVSFSNAQSLSYWEVHDLLRGRRKVTVGEDGTFRFENVPLGRYKLRAKSRSGAARSRTVEVHEQRTNPPIRLVVEPLAKVTGSLSGLMDDERATLWVKTSDRRTIMTVDDFANGPFEISGIPNGEFVLAAVSSTSRVLESAFKISNHEAVRIDFAFSWSSRLWGRVRAGPGKGPLRMEVVATPQDEAMPVGTSWTAPDGSYEIAGLGDGTYGVVARGTEFSVEVAGDTEFDPTLPPNSLAGTIWAMGDTLGGRIVVARAVEGNRPLVVHAETRLDAKFRFDGLPEGQYAVVVMDPFWAGAVRHVYVNSAIEGFDFQLEPTDDLRSIKVTNLDTPKGELEVYIERGDFDRLWIHVGLNEDGVGMLPRSLKGADLRVSLDGAQANVPNWDGGDLFVELESKEE